MGCSCFLLLFENPLAVAFAVDQPLCQQAHGDGDEDVHHGVLLDEGGGHTDENDRHGDKDLEPRAGLLPLRPHRQQAERIAHMERGAHARIGVEGVEEGTDGGEDVFIGKLLGPQVLPRGEDDVAGRGHHLRDDDVFGKVGEILGVVE